MRWLFLFFGLFCYLEGFVIYTNAQAVTQQIAALIMFLIGTVWVVGAGIVSAIEERRGKASVSMV